MEIPWDYADPKEKEPTQWSPRLSSIDLTADGSTRIPPNESFDKERFLYNVNLNGGSYGILEIDAVPENPEDTVSVFVDGAPSTTINNPQPGKFFVVEVSNWYKSTTYIVAVTSGPPGTARLESLTVNSSMSQSPPLVYDVLIPAGTDTTVAFAWTVDAKTKKVEYSVDSGARWYEDTTKQGFTTGFTVAPNTSKILLIRLTSLDQAQTTYYINVRRAGATGNTLLSLTVGGSSVVIGYTMRPAYAEIGYPAGTFAITAGFPSGGTVTYSGDITGSPTVGTSGTTSTITCGTLSAGVSKTILITVTEQNGASNTHVLILYKPDAYYVSAAGGTTNSGETAAAPFNQLKTALDAAQASGGKVNRVVVMGELAIANAAGLDNPNYTFTLGSYGAPGGTLTISGMNNAGLKASSTNGVILIENNSYLNFENITITGGSRGGSGAAGGGININNSMVTLSNGTRIKENSARSGAGIFIDGGTLWINGADISNNTASGGTESCGGGIYVKNPTAEVIFSSGAISGNKALGDCGGGICVVDWSNFKMDGGNIYGNSTSGNGGGIYVGSAGTMIYTSGSIRTNVVGTVGTHYGKSIYNDGTVSGSIPWALGGTANYCETDLP